MRVCETAGCGGKYHARGLCKPCYRKLPDVKAAKNARAKEKYATDPEYRKSQADRQREKHATDPEWREKNKARKREHAKTPHARALKRARDHARRAAKLKACPPWADRAALRVIFENCPEGWHVDHIVPLNAEGVRGWHVPWNLQYLPAKANLSKGNKVIVELLANPPYCFAFEVPIFRPEPLALSAAVAA